MVKLDEKTMHHSPSPSTISKPPMLSKYPRTWKYGSRQDGGPLSVKLVLLLLQLVKPQPQPILQLSEISPPAAATNQRNAAPAEHIH